jgi:hypothetical protein
MRFPASNSANTEICNDHIGSAETYQAPRQSCKYPIAGVGAPSVTNKPGKSLIIVKRHDVNSDRVQTVME